MNYKTVELQLLQLEEAFSKSRSNIYSDKKKEDHFKELYDLFNAIKNSDYKNSSIAELNNYSFLITYIFTGIEYLDNSTLNITPYEIVSCLEHALGDWIVKDNFIIVTSLSNKKTDFYLETNDNNELFKMINDLIKNSFNLQLTHRLIKISLPKVLSRDYLSCVVLYHELGHFIDHELNISKKLLLNKYAVNNPQDKEQEIYLNHTMEYFADLFAAQYIDNASNLYLNYIAFSQEDSSTHPATSKRIEVVDKFLSDKKCPEILNFNMVLKASGSPEIKKRYKLIELKKSDFLKLIPQNIKNKEELHYIFKLGWEFWNNSEINFLKTFKNRQKYHIINNLVEKSISNYTITTKWQEI
jgi:hypothetical protein